MTQIEQILRELASQYFILKDGTKIQRTKGNKKVTIKIEKRKIEDM